MEEFVLKQMGSESLLLGGWREIWTKVFGGYSLKIRQDSDYFKLTSVVNEQTMLTALFGLSQNFYTHY